MAAKVAAWGLPFGSFLWERSIRVAIGDQVAGLHAQRCAARLTGIDIAGAATELVHPDLAESSMDVIIGVAAAIA